MMNNFHGFNVNLAVAVGMEKALLLGRIYFLWDHSLKTNRNNYGGRYWMFDSSVALERMYPYLKERSIRKWMNELEHDGWIVSGNFNSKAYDKTKWYTIGKRFEEFLLTEKAIPDEHEKQPQTEKNGKTHGTECRGFAEQQSDGTACRGSEIAEEKSGIPREIHSANEDENASHGTVCRGSEKTGESHGKNGTSDGKNCESHGKNGKSHGTVCRPIPVIELSNRENSSSSCSEDEKNNDDDDPKKEEGNFNDPEFVTERIHRLYLSCFGKMPNSFELSELRKTVVVDTARSGRENFAIMVQAFHKAALDLKTQNTRYVLGVIRGMKQDLAIAEQKKFKEAEMQRARTEEMRRQQQMKLGLEDKERPRLREMFEDEVMKQKRQAV